MTTRYFKVKGGIVTGNIVLDEASGNITGLNNANLGNLASANFFSGNGWYLTAINGANISGQVGNALVAGTVYSNAQPNITSLGTLTRLTISGNTTSGNFTTTGDVSGGTLTGTLTTAAQPNVTSLGTLSGLTSTGTIDFTGASNVSLGVVSNLHIGGGTNGYVLQTNGSGGLTWVSPGSTGIAGSNTQIQFNDGGSFGASSGLTFDKGTLTLSVTGNISSGNANLGNLATANFFSGNGAQLSAITGANVTGTVANANVATFAGTVTTNAQPNITSVGTLSSLSVTGTVDAGNVYANAGTVGGQFLKGDGYQISNIAGGNVTGQVGNALVAGTVYTNAQPNITSVGTLVDLTVTGNVSAGNVTATLYTGTLTTAAQPNITSLGTLADANVTGNVVIGGNLVINGNLNYVNVDTLNVEDPVIELGGGPNGAPLTTNDGKDRGTLLHYYSGGAIDAFMGWDNSNTEFVLSSNVTNSNDVMTFNELGNVRAAYFLGNGSQLTGVAATTATTAGTVTTNAQPNITSVGTLSSLSVTGNVDAGNLNANAGTVNALYIKGDGYQLSNIAGANVTGTVANANVATFAGTVTTNAQPNITSVGTLSSLSVTGDGTFGNVWANAGTIGGQFIKGDGYQLSNIAGGNVTGQVGNALVAGTVYTAAQPNITSVGTLSSVSVSGNATAGGLLTDNLYYANGQPWDFQLPAGSNNYVQYNDNGSFGANVNFTYNPSTSTLSAPNISGNLTTATQANITSVGTLTAVSISGNVTTGGILTDNYYYANGAPLDFQQPAGSNTQVQYNDNNNFGASANFVFNSTSETLTVTNFSGNGSGLSAITGANVTGQVGNALVAGTVYTAAQPNITSVGTLTSLAVTGNATVGNVVINGGVLSNRANVSVSTDTVIDQFAPSSFRTAKYVISASGDNGYQSVETLLVHDGVNSYITIYGSICSNVSADIIDVTSNINGTSGNVSLYATASGPNTIVNVVATYLKT